MLMTGEKSIAIGQQGGNAFIEISQGGEDGCKVSVPTSAASHCVSKFKLLSDRTVFVGCFSTFLYGLQVQLSLKLEPLRIRLLSPCVGLFAFRIGANNFKF